MTHYGEFPTNATFNIDVLFKDNSGVALNFVGTPMLTAKLTRSGAVFNNAFPITKIDNNGNGRYGVVPTTTQNLLSGKYDLITDIALQGGAPKYRFFDTITFVRGEGL